MGGWGGGIGTEGESERTRERVGMTERDRREEEGGGEEEIKRERDSTQNITDIYHTVIMGSVWR